MKEPQQNMILIADSGSTKTDWRLIDRAGTTYCFKTFGFNPYFQDTPAILNEIRTTLLPDLEKVFLPSLTAKKLKIYFYGAGCSSDVKCSVIRHALIQAFPDAEIEVEHDLLAAARALCGNDKGIAAILGTGSNSCYYDGQNIVHNVASLGFILGDEGSGAHIGKLFMQDYLNKEVPVSIAENFYESYKLNKELILDAIYKESMPSRFLASFSKFINENKNEQYMADLIEQSFNQFFSKHICKYANHQQVKMSCVGSVAFYYSDMLRAIAEKRGVVINKIIESPIADLSSYHLNKSRF